MLWAAWKRPDVGWASASVLLQIEVALGLSGADALRYADPKKGQHRTVRLVRQGEQVELTGFVLAGDTSAEAWIKTLLLEELPAQAYGRQLLLPGKPVCTCFNVTDAAIANQLALIQEDAGGAADLMRDKKRLAALQGALQCGTNCGSCVPELKRLVRSARLVPICVNNSKL